MRTKKSGFKKFMAKLLCVVLIAGIIPQAVFAAVQEDTGSGFAASGYEEEEDGEEIEDWGDELRLLAATPSDASPDGEAGMDGETPVTFLDAIPEEDDVASLLADGETTYYTTVQAAVDEAGTKKAAVIMLAGSTENVKIASDQDITLDLAGYTLDGGKDDSVIINNGTLTLRDSVGSGCLTNGVAYHGGGVRNTEGATFTMESGTICNNFATGSGGGIDNNGGVLNIKGGTISGNFSTSGGGVCHDHSDSFTMSGGTITDNEAMIGAGVQSSGDFTMYSGEISYNTSSYRGGGVLGTITMHGGIICNNSCPEGGGGIRVEYPSFFDGGTITGNSAAFGGGVHNNSTFNMQGGAIYSNTAKSYGADIYSAGGSTALAIPDAVAMLGNEDSEHCFKWHKDEKGNRYSTENITEVYDDENVINAQSPSRTAGAVPIIAAWDERHLYREENVTFTWNGSDSCTATFICADCEHAEKVECGVTPESITEPTCTDAGSAIYTAAASVTSRDGELAVTDEQAEEITAPGHDWQVERTVLEDSEGRTVEHVSIKCTRCGLEYEEEIAISGEDETGGSEDEDGGSEEENGGSGGSGSGSGRGNGSNARSSGGSSGSGVSGASASPAYSTGTWTIDEYGHWRFTDAGGRRYENEWGTIYNPYADTSVGQPPASWFHFGFDGIMDTGWYTDTEGNIYYLNPDPDNTQGAMFTGWVFIDGKWYCFDAGGELLRDTQIYRSQNTFI